MRDFFKEEYQLNHVIGSLPFPHVALLDGITSMAASSFSYWILMDDFFELCLLCS